MPLQAPQTGAPFLRRARRSNKAMTLENDPFELLAFTFHLAFTFYIVILALRILEHWFLVSPIRELERQGQEGAERTGARRTSAECARNVQMSAGSCFHCRRARYLKASARAEFPTPRITLARVGLSPACPAR